jgi:TusA-related sulfurtransferase
MISQEYNKQYVTLKSRIRKLKSRLILSVLNDSTLTMIRHIDEIAKELDLQYSDERSFDIIENTLESLEREWHFA